MKILAVDDDPFIRDLFPSIFERVEVKEVHTASSGAAALSAIDAEDQPFDCFMLDVDMPEMDGIELCKRIRALPGYGDKPILMLTARTDPVAIENAFAAGANDYISKPFNLKDIYNRIRVAERLLEASKTVKRLEHIDVSDRARRGIHSFDLSEKVCLANVERLIPSFSLGNYLTQIDRGDLGNCQVFCVALDDAEMLFDHSTSREFFALITRIADAIYGVLPCPNLLMSYEGSGSFLCITRDPELPEWDVLETALQSKTDEIAHMLNERTDKPVSISVGTPISPYANRTQRVKKTFDRALGRAQARSITKRSAA